MHIDSSSLLSLFSSVDGLENLQPTLQTNEEVTQEFTETLLEKISQLTGLDEFDPLAENFVVDSQQGINKLHEVSALFGKNLPLDKLEKEIDLENTLEALTNVVNTLKEVVSEEQSQDNKVVITEQFERESNTLYENGKVNSFHEGEVINKNNVDVATVDKHINTNFSEDEIVKLANQISTLVALQNAPIGPEKLVGNNFQQVKPEIKNDIHSLKQISNEETYNNTSKTGSNNLLQQENAFSKSKQDKNM